MWKKVPRQTTKRTRNSSLRKIEPAEENRSAASNYTQIREKMKRKHGREQQRSE
jgi:hypothetical protein